MKGEYRFQNKGLFNWWHYDGVDWPMEIFSGLLLRLHYTEWVKSDVVMKAGGQLETAWSGYGYILQNEYDEWFQNHIKIGIPEPTGDYIQASQYNAPVYAIPIQYSIPARFINMELFTNAKKEFRVKSTDLIDSGVFEFEWIFNSLMTALAEIATEDVLEYGISKKWSRTHLENPNGTYRSFENYEKMRPFRLLAFVSPPDSTSKNIAYYVNRNNSSKEWWHEAILSEDKLTVTWTILATPTPRHYGEHIQSLPSIPYAIRMEGAS